MSQVPVPRSQALDITRGIGIILVVFGHLQRGFVDLGASSHSPAMRLCDFVLYTTHMPLFFLLAGTTTHASLGKQGPAAFTATRLRTIVWPYFLWSALFVLVQRLAATATGVNHLVPLAALLLLPVVPIGIFWFLQSLALAQGAALLLRRFPLSFLIGALLADCVLTAAGPSNPVPILTQTVLHLPFFAFGFFAAARELRAPAWLGSAINALPAAFATVGLAVMAVALSAKWPVDAVTLPISCFGIATILIIARALTDSAVGRRLVAIGRASMPIYVIHIFTLPIFMRLIRGLSPALDLLLLPLGTIFGVVTSMALYRMLKGLGWDRVLGLSPPRKILDARSGIRPKLSPIPDRRNSITRAATL